MKKVMLVAAMVFATSSLVSAENNETYVRAEATCWEKADAAEKEFCGSVGCSDDFWLGYMDACTGA